MSRNTTDPHAIPEYVASSYYAGLPSRPALIYRAHPGNPWFPLSGHNVFHRRKLLCPVFEHPLANLWNSGLWKDVQKAMDLNGVHFTTMDVVRFRAELDDEAEEQDEEEANTPALSPVTIWVGVPEATAPTACHNAALAVLSLLAHHDITDVNLEFRASEYRAASRGAAALVLPPVSAENPLRNVQAPLTSNLGFPVSAVSKPDSQGTMALFLAEEGSSDDRLLGLTCRHVLFDNTESNSDYRPHPDAPDKNVTLLSQKGYDDHQKLIDREIAGTSIMEDYWERTMQRFQGQDDAPAQEGQRLARENIEKCQEKREKLRVFDPQFKRLVDPNSRVLGPVLFSPAIKPGPDGQQFLEDWAVFEVPRSKLGNRFQGNKLDLGTAISVGTFTLMCALHPGSDWNFQYPVDHHLPLRGIIGDEDMRIPGMKDRNGDPCLLVVKTGAGTGTSIGKANGVRSVVRTYNPEGERAEEASVAWCVLPLAYDGTRSVEPFAGDGDSGSVVVDIRGRLGGMLTGGGGWGSSLVGFDTTYVTPFWWLLERIRANGFPDAHADV
ncbi:hypothetical protein EYR36_007908 [Pleurotus pulmonarius]|nr:hypothetical protein EYR36_007908 [Pleurotus pulmonarius]